MAARADLCIVTLGIDDLARSRAFYAALGWEATDSSNDEIAWFRTPHSYLGLFGRDALAEDAQIEPGGRTAFGGITLAINCPSEAWEVAFNPNFPIGEDGRLQIP